MRQDKNHESNNITYFELTLLKLLLLILLYSRLCFKYIKKTQQILSWSGVELLTLFNKTAKYKTSYREHAAVSNKGL
jgi:hypothetical protein